MARSALSGAGPEGDVILERPIADVCLAGVGALDGIFANGDGARLPHGGVHRAAKTVVWVRSVPVIPIISPSPLSSPVEGEGVENVDAAVC
jgi:hypothetical protein